MEEVWLMEEKMKAKRGQGRKRIGMTDDLFENV